MQSRTNDVDDLDWKRLLDALDGVVYITDSEGHILATGTPGWDGFAILNGRPDLVSGLAIGRSIFEYMVGGEVIRAARSLHAAVADGSRGAVLYPYRCDAPDRRRHMRMSVSAMPSRAGPLVLYQSQLLSETERPWINLFDPRVTQAYLSAHTILPTVKLCSYCQLIGWPIAAPVEWIEAHDYYARGGADAVIVSHGVCEACASALAVE